MFIKSASEQDIIDMFNGEKSDLQKSDFSVLDFFIIFNAITSIAALIISIIKLF